jgi:hypothetical protein
MTLDVKPIVRRLQRNVNILGGFKLENGETSVARNREHVEDAVLAVAVREDLRVNKPRVERCVNASDIFANQGLEPRFGLRAIERITSRSRARD